MTGPGSLPETSVNGFFAQQQKTTAEMEQKHEGARGLYN
jgi:hypothetical protein